MHRRPGIRIKLCSLSMQNCTMNREKEAGSRPAQAGSRDGLHMRLGRLINIEHGALDPPHTARRAKYSFRGKALNKTPGYFPLVRRVRSVFISKIDIVCRLLLEKKNIVSSRRCWRVAMPIF